MDHLPPAFRDLLTGGEDEERQDFMSPAERARPTGGQDHHRTHSMARELPAERVPATEHAAGVTLDGLYAVVSGPGDETDLWVQVNGEIGMTGDQPPGPLAVVAAVYDSANRVLGTLEQHWFEQFLGWDVFSVTGVVPGIPARVRVFVRRTG